MISPEYCLTMARYNAWQNRAMRGAMQNLSPDDLTRDRGAFFGSILGTANHLLWADRLWMSRFADLPVPAGSGKESPQFMPTLAAWGAERFRADGQILLWAEKLRALDLTGELRWYSGLKGADVSRPRAAMVVHFFNHQTHHRGQIHAMLTAAGLGTEDTDLMLMPTEGPWL